MWKAAENRRSELQTEKARVKELVHNFLSELKQQAVLSANAKLHEALAKVHENMESQENSVLRFASQLRDVLADMENARRKAKTTQECLDSTVIANREQTLKNLAGGFLFAVCCADECVVCIEKLTSMRLPVTATPDITFFADATLQLCNIIQSSVSVSETPLSTPVLAKVEHVKLGVVKFRWHTDFSFKYARSLCKL